MINQALVNSSTDLMWSIDKNYKLIAFNDAFKISLKLFTGYDFNINDNVLTKEYFEDDYLSYWKSLYDRGFNGEKVVVEIYSPAKDSIELLCYEINMRSMYQEDEIYGIACFGKDITERKIAVDLLAENEKRYRDILNNLEAGVVIHNPDTSIHISNAKASEFHAAMGLCVLDALGDIISHRKNVSIAYDRQLNFNKIRKPISPFEITYNYAYYPVVFESEEILLNVKAGLEANGIMARRYFYPSLNTLPFLQKKDVCLNSELISKKILCLPLSSYLQDSEVDTICRIINTIIE